jgi:tetratricopeptide (TPR) repeat protein
MFILNNPTSYLLILELIVFFILTERKAIFGLLFILVSTAVSIIFFNGYTLNYILIAYATLKTFKENKSQHELEINSIVNSLAITSIILMVMLVSRPIHSDYIEKVKQQYHRFNTEYLNTKQEDKIGIKEGRKINYIENTLTDKYTRAELLATGFSTIAEYIRLTIYPAELSFYYGYAKIKTENFSNKTAWLGLLLYVSLIAIALWQIKKNILISIGITWYLLSISLFSNWIEPIAGMVGERLAYTASVGFCLALAAFVLWLKPNFSLLKPKGMELIIIVILGLFSLRSISRNSDWMDPITLMEHDIEHLENSAQAHNLLALNLMYVSSSNKNLNPQQVLEMQNKAAFHLQKSTTIYPYFFNTNFDLARIYINLGDNIKAKQALIQALKIDPNNLFALEEMAKTCYELKLADETESYANKYLAQIPQNENMHEILIYNMLASGKYESAIYYAERAMSYYPSNQIIQKMYTDAQNMMGAAKLKNQ